MKNKIENILKNKLIKNMTYIFSGSMIAAILTLLNTVILVKSIGLEKKGIIFLGLSYVGFFNALFNFESYQAIIKFLPSCMDFGNEKGQNYIKQGIILDAITAVFAFGVSYMLVDISGNYFNWGIQTRNHFKILTITILFTVAGAFTGILRIYEKFKEISWINIFTAAINTFLYIIGSILKLELSYYIYFVVISIFLSKLLILFLVYRTLKENGMSNLYFFKTKFDKEFIKFTIYTNLSSTLDLPVFHITPFIISKYLGFSDIAIYKILEKIGGIITRITGTMAQVLMPEISKRLSSGDKEGAYRIGFKIGKIVATIGMIGLIFVSLTYKFWLGYFIPDYDSYIVATYLYLFFVIFTQMFIAQHPILVYSGYVKEELLLLITVNTVYVFILLFFTKQLGISGIILSLIIQAAMVFTGTAIILKIKNKGLNESAMMLEVVQEQIGENEI